MNARIRRYLLMMLLGSVSPGVYAFLVSTNSAGAEIKWSVRSVSFRINSTYAPVGTVTAIQSAMTTWSTVAGSDFDFVYAGATTLSGADYEDRKNVCSFGDLGTGGTIAMNTFWFSASGSILASDIVFNTNYAWSVSGEVGKMDVQNIATHELGHSLSLADLYNYSVDREKTMYGYGSNGEIKKQTLDPDDIAGILYLYPNSSYTVTFDAQGGSVSPVSIIVTNGLSYGTLPTPTRTGYAFSGWWTGSGGTGAEVTSATIVTITAAQTLYAKWTVSFYTLTVNSGTGSGSYTNGQPVAITASDLRSGVTFKSWIGDTAYVDNVTYTNALVTMPTNSISLTATYYYTLTITNGNGTSTAPYTNNARVNISADTVTGMTFSQWTGDANLLSSNTLSTTVIMSTNPAALTATYSENTYTLTVNGGSGSGDYYAGTELTIVANPPPEGLVFDQWSGDTGALSSNTASTTFFTPAANIAVTATYKSAAVELTATVSGGNGTISPASASVSPGNSTNFVITATNYYRISTLTTNGTSAGVAFNNLSTNYTYTWSNVQAAGTVTVSFVQQVTTNAPATVPYSWLAQYFVTNDYNAGALADQDGDGMQTWQEYIAGTIPNNATSCLKVAQAIRNTISWSPVTGRIYSVHWATNLQNSFQSLETNIVWPQAGYTDTLHGAESRSFYKVKVQLAP